MSVVVKYKGNTIASASTEVTKTLKTSGKYCEADILVENTPDGGDAPVINPLSITANGTYTAPSGVDGYSPINVNVPQGITPTGNINITDTNVTDVTNYATAQVVDADLIASNIKKDVNILGVVGSFEGGGGRSIMCGNYQVADNSDTPNILYLDNRNPNAYLALIQTFDNLGRTYAVDISGEDFKVGTSGWNTDRVDNAIERIVCPSTPNIRLKITSLTQTFRGTTKLVKIEPLIDFSEISSAWNRTWDNNGGAALETVRCVPNTLQYTMSWYTASLLDNASIVSIANSIVAGANTLAFHATVKGKLTAIMGTVSQVTDETGTYDFFTASESGTVSLENFITQTKGWTIA